MNATVGKLPVQLFAPILLVRKRQLQAGTRSNTAALLPRLVDELASVDLAQKPDALGMKACASVNDSALKCWPKAKNSSH